MRSPDRNETPTPAEIRNIMEASRINLQALLFFVVSEHRLSPESAARFIGRSTTRVIQDFRLESEGRGFSSYEAGDTDPIPLVRIKMEELTAVDVITKERDDKTEPESPGVEPFDVNEFFSDMMEEDTAAMTLAENGDTRVLEPRGKGAIPPLTETPMIPRASLNKLMKQMEEATPVTVPATQVAPGSLTEAILLLAEAEAHFTLKPDGEVKPRRRRKRLELDFGDF